jgi:hypothetical protein
MPRKPLLDVDPSPQMVKLVKRKWRAEDNLERINQQMTALRSQWKRWKRRYKNAVDDITALATYEGSK